MLTGIIFDETGDRLSPSHSSKQGKRYRYYVSHRLLQAHRKGKDGWRLPAEQVETIVLQQVVKFLQDRPRLLDLLGPEKPCAQDVADLDKAAETAIVHLDGNEAIGKRKVLRAIVERITIKPNEIVIDTNRRRIATAIAGTEADTQNSDEPVRLIAPVRLRRRGIETKLVLTRASTISSEPDSTLINLIGEALYYRDQLTSGRANSLADLSELSGKATNEISRILPLGFLAPDIVQKIMAGEQPVELTAQALKRATGLPLTWTQQRHRLGFAVHV